MTQGFASAQELTPDDYKNATLQQEVKSLQNLRMRVRGAWDLYTLDAFAVKFKHRAETNRRVCVCKLRSQEGEWEVMCVVPSDEPRKLFIEHDVSVAMTQDLMPFVLMQNQCHDFYEQERRKQTEEHPMVAQQRHSKFYFSSNALLEEVRQSEAQKHSQEEQQKLEAAVATMPAEKVRQLKALAEQSKGTLRIKAPQTPAFTSPATPASLSGLSTAAPQTPAFALGHGRVGGLVGSSSASARSDRSSAASVIASSPPSKADAQSARLPMGRSGRWIGSTLDSKRASLNSALSSRASSCAGRVVGALSARSPSSKASSACLIDMDPAETEVKLRDFTAIMLGTFTWTVHNRAVYCFCNMDFCKLTMS